ncbi:MAG: flagellar basal body rod protein FlgC [Vulcanibacillus sp.]
MKLFQTMDISASALTTQRLRLDVISSNIANAETTRGRLVNGKWEPYTRKMIAVESNTGSNFQHVLHGVQNNENNQYGVKVTAIVEDTSPYKKAYQPSHPDADENGFVYFPNVDLLAEMIDMTAAERAYEANVTALNSTKSILMKALEIGK